MTRRSPRRGFTLVELLVAIALGIVLLSVAVAVSQSTAFESYKVVGAADRVSQWMLVAKNKALRDKAPRGIRLVPDQANPSFVKEIAYIEQPDPWVPTPNVVMTATSPRLIVQRMVAQSPPPMSPPAQPLNGQSVRVFLINIPNPTGTVQVGDTLYLPEVGQSFLIAGIVDNPAASDSATTPNPAPQTGATAWPTTGTAAVTWVKTSVVELVLTTPTQLGDAFGAGYAQTQSPPFTVAPTYQTTNFAVYRQPRVLLGEPTQQLPSGMAVDLGNSLNPPTGGTLDILFSPSGEVIGNASGLMGLLVRDVNLPNAGSPLTAAGYPNAGQMIVICLYPRTGAIATQPVNPPPAADAFQFAKDGVNTGL